MGREADLLKASVTGDVAKLEVSLLYSIVNGIKSMQFSYWSLRVSELD